MRKTLHEVNAGESSLLVTHGGGEGGEGQKGRLPCSDSTGDFKFLLEI